MQYKLVNGDIEKILLTFELSTQCFVVPSTESSFKQYLFYLWPINALIFKDKWEEENNDSI